MAARSVSPIATILRISKPSTASHLVACAHVRRRCATLEEGFNKILGLQVHTDAAFAGQGLVAEVLQLAKLPAYATGGTIHIVINNQVGFTTDPANGRSSVFCTDVASTVGAPVLHVNGDDVDAVVRTATIAAEFRIAFPRRHRRRPHLLPAPRSQRSRRADLHAAGHVPQGRGTSAGAADLSDPSIKADGLMTHDEIEWQSRACFDRLDAAYQAIESYRPNRIAWKSDLHGGAPALPTMRAFGGRRYQHRRPSG